MRTGIAFLGGYVLVLALAACTPVPPSVEPTPTATIGPLTPTRTATMTPSTRTDRPTPAPSPTPGPTLDVARVIQMIGAQKALLTSRRIEPLCLQWENVDDDEQPEWVGLYLQSGDLPRLRGFVLDGDNWHELGATQEDEEGLGTYPSCELEVRDINVDGQTEILVEGHTKSNVDLLHIFVWDRTSYELLASFRGNAGIKVMDINGDIAQEIVARFDAGDGLAWEQIHTWDGTRYGWTWERYGWLYADHPHAYPTGSPQRAVISFYLALNDRNLPLAHRLFSSEAERSQPYETWAAGFHSMLAVEVGSVREIDRQGGRAKVTAQVRAYDNLEGYVVGRLWDVTWNVMQEDGMWQLQDSRSVQLDQWEAPYFP